MTENGTGETKDILRVGKRGKRKCQLGDENAPIFEVDVISTLNAWREVNRKFVDEKGEIPEERRAVQYAALFTFVRDTAANLCYPGKEQERERYGYIEQLNKEMSVADAWHFMKLIQDEADALLPFFVPKSASPPSSQGTTDVIYST